MNGHAPSMSKSALLLGPCLHWAGPGKRWYDQEKIKPEDQQKTTDGIVFHKAMDRTAKSLAKQGSGSPVGDTKGQTIGPVPTSLIKAYQHASKFLKELQDRCDGPIVSESAVRVNWRTGAAELLDCKDRDYPNDPDWQPGTGDLRATLNDGRLWVGDWKTGTTDGCTEQLKSLAYGFRECLPDDFGDKRKVVVCTLFVNEDGVWGEEKEVSDDELTAHRIAMFRQWQLKDFNNSAVPGVHCTALYCPHLAYCEAISDVTRQLAAGEAAQGGVPLVKVQDLLRGKKQLSDEPVTDAEAGYTMAVVQAVKRQINYLTEGAKKRISNGDRVTHGGYEWHDKGNGYRWHKS